MSILLFFLFLIILIEFFIVVVYFSRIAISVDKCDIAFNDAYLKKFYVRDFELSITMYILKFIKLINIKVTNNYIKVCGIKIDKKHFSKFKNKSYSKSLFSKIIKLIKRHRDTIDKLNVVIDSVDLDISYGTISNFLTTFSVPTLSTIISILLSKYVPKYDMNKCRYKITPNYNYINNFNIKLNLKINFETLNLIFVILELKRIEKSTIRALTTLPNN